MRAACALTVVIAALASAPQPANAQPAPCGLCSRGDALIEHYSLQPLRKITDELRAFTPQEPISAEDYARIVDLRQRTQALVRVGAVDDEGLVAIAASLCQVPSGSCNDAVVHALRCAADRCAVDLPKPREPDVLEPPRECSSWAAPKRTPVFGLGVDWGNGWHRSRYPNDGFAWSLGIDARMRLGRRLGVVARIDRIAGRDEGTDADGDGSDDTSTGSITRISALAGPSFAFDVSRFERMTRYLRLDVLAGVVSTRSQPDETGPAVGIDLGYHLAMIRVGMRVVQGIGGAQDSTIVLGHIGLVSGSVPPYHDPRDCDGETSPRSSRLGLGFDIPLGGYGVAKELGYLATGIAFEALWHHGPSIDFVGRVDLLLYPGKERDRVIHRALLAGVRIDHGEPRKRSEAVGFHSTIAAGYSLGAGLRPTTTGSGPIIDAAFGWGLKGDEAAAYLRLHGRFGVHPDNFDYRAIFLSGGFELHLDPRRWRDRS